MRRPRKVKNPTALDEFTRRETLEEWLARIGAQPSLDRTGVPDDVVLVNVGPAMLAGLAESLACPEDEALARMQAVLDARWRQRGCQ